MFRTHTCGELRISDVNKQITLSGWVQRSRKMGGMTFIDLRDRYGITQLVFNEEINAELCDRANKLGREFVIQITGTVNERFSKNANIPTGDIEIIVSELNVLNTAMTPPFTIEDNTDGGDDIRMKYRYLDLRRNAVRSNLELRHKMTIEVRKYLDSLGFIEVETPVLIGSTPEGARDFVVPSRMNPGQFYALPQSPQTLKQLLMVSGFDRYFQIAKCFRDEDLRADRQPEFTQIDCEMSFVEQEDIISTFEGMAKHLFKTLRGVELGVEIVRDRIGHAGRAARPHFCHGDGLPSSVVSTENHFAGFSVEKLRLAAAHAPCAHVCEPSGIFSAVHAAGENDRNFFAPAGANSARLLERSSRAGRPGAGRKSFLYIYCTAYMLLPSTFACTAIGRP